MDPKDRKSLLHFAVKATKKRWKWDDTGVPRMYHYDPINSVDYWFLWNPLENNTDCALLESTLNIDTLWLFNGKAVMARPSEEVDGWGMTQMYCTQDCGKDKLAARRLAVVIVAARFGGLTKERAWQLQN